MTMIVECLNWGKKILEASRIPQANIDASVLLCHVLGVEKTYLLTWPEKEVSSQEAANFQTLVQLRATGKPIAYILGEQEFWSMPFKVTEHTLIPRADTEILVESILKQLADTSSKMDILELGTGSGAIACALAFERPKWHIYAVDICDEALKVAQYNAQQLGLSDSIQYLRSSWFNTVPNQKFDAIVSNPPYVESNSIHLSEGTYFEPQSALISGPDGLDDIRIIIAQAKHYLNSNGILFLEHGFEQADSVRALFDQYGYTNIQNIKDYAGCPRVSFACMGIK